MLLLLLTGFWGAYSSFSKHGRATFGFISFTFLSILLDIVFCSINCHRASMFKFCLTMFIICMMLKVYALYQSSLFFTSIGGAYSLESSKLTTSMYESLSKSIATVLVLCISDTVGCDVCTQFLCAMMTQRTVLYHHPYRDLSALSLQSRGERAGRVLPPGGGRTCYDVFPEQK